MTLLDDLMEVYQKAFEKGFEIIEIDLKPVAHKKLKDELEKTMNKPNINEIKSLFGIPVVIDDTIPSNKLWIMKMKESHNCPVIHCYECLDSETCGVLRT